VEHEKLVPVVLQSDQGTIHAVDHPAHRREVNGGESGTEGKHGKMWAQ